MKLGKKRSTDEVTEKETKHSGTDGDKKKATTPKRKRLSGVAGIQAAAVLASGVLAAFLVSSLVVQPAEQARYEQLAAPKANMAAERLNQYLVTLQTFVSGLASQPYVTDAMGTAEARAAVQQQLTSAFPGMEAVYLFPYGEIPRTAGEFPTLGFAGLDLARRAESGRTTHPDAFPRNGHWLFQMVAPVRASVNSAVRGTMLVVMSADALENAMGVVSPDLGGQVSLIQSVSGSDKVVTSAGDAGSGEPLERTLLVPHWKVRYTPSAALSPLIPQAMVFVLVIAPVLLAAVLVWFLLTQAQKGLRRDIAQIVQWARKIFGGERQRQPEMQWDLMAPLGEGLQRFAQLVEKRIEKIAESARAAKPEGGRKPSPSVEEEPLFQDRDMPDIDMLDGDDDVLGFGDDTPGGDGLDVQEVSAPQVEVPDEIFRAYDIRGIVGSTLTDEIVDVIGRAIGSEALARGQHSLCIGYDGRHSSPGLAQSLARGVIAAGCDVVEIGAVPTPVLYFATHHLQNGSGVMVTGSHNPPDYNGLKIMLGGETLSGGGIRKLLQRIRTGDITEGQGSVSREDVRRDYLDRILGDIAVAAPLRVVMDAGNGIAGELGPMLVEELGCEVIPLHCEVDGNFPNHHPDPGKPENLEDLIARVQEEKADIGLAFDGDGDRLGVVTNTGKIIWPDRLLMLFARDVVSRNPGADVLYDVKCSRRLASVITEAGGRPIMWKSGHSLMKAKMKETGALLAGELSGHVFFGERWYGFDDGLYSAARLLEILGIEDRDSDEVFRDFPEDISTPELNIQVTEDSKFPLMEKLAAEASFGDGSVSTIDGVRVDFPDGWGLCRASNTTPVLVLRFEAETEEALERIKELFREQLQKVAPDLVADF
ncbi:MAG TPA: phosphomannomutase/phosphoglucomutase [Marinobacter sp.]|nr:phosphomannomutase/phosphoglucomutase [Marinobacter sp.]